jgi:2-C-methyl-D-erythritol 4-phosphate cytidylyltransferase
MIKHATAIILAAGSSNRIGSDKAFIEIGGKPLIAWSVDVCQNSVSISDIVLVFNDNNINAGKRLCSAKNWTKVSDICLGGKRRQDSVKKGLGKIHNSEWVLIHDGARPFITDDLIVKGVSAAMETGAAIAAVPVKDTIKQAGRDLKVEKTLNRDSLWAVQTPQIYRFDIITEAYRLIKEDVTDDATMVEKLGCNVKIYMGSYSNIKVTTNEDLVIAKMIASGGYYR